MSTSCYFFSTPSQMNLSHSGDVRASISTSHRNTTSQQMVSSSLSPVSKQELFPVSTSSSTSSNQLKRTQNLRQDTSTSGQQQRNRTSISQQQHLSPSLVTTSSPPSSCPSSPSSSVALRRKARRAPLPPDLTTSRQGERKNTLYCTEYAVDTQSIDVQSQRVYKQNQGFYKFLFLDLHNSTIRYTLIS